MTKTTKLIFAIAVFAVLLLAAVLGYNALSRQYKPQNDASITNSKVGL